MEEMYYRIIDLVKKCEGWYFENKCGKNNGFSLLMAVTEYCNIKYKSSYIEKLIYTTHTYVLEISKGRFVSSDCSSFGLPSAFYKLVIIEAGFSLVLFVPFANIMDCVRGVVYGYNTRDN